MLPALIMWSAATVGSVMFETQGPIEVANIFQTFADQLLKENLLTNGQPHLKDWSTERMVILDLHK